MATLSQHITNRASEPHAAQNPFRNDVNNVAALQNARIQKKLMEEAEQQQKQRFAAINEEKEEVEQDRNALRKEMLQLEARFNKLGIQSAEAENKAMVMQTKMEDALSQVEKIKQDKETEKELIKRNFEAERKAWQIQLNAITGMELQIQNLGNMVIKARETYAYGGQENCLPDRFHGAEVMITNMQSTLAVDAGLDAETRAHGHEFNPGNNNQVFLLHKVNGPDDESPHNYWTITLKKNQRKLYYPSSGTWVRLHSGVAPPRQDCWYIGVGNKVGTWVLKNAEWNTYIGMQRGTVNLLSSDSSDALDAQWIIVPLRFSR